jgi:oligosaccharide repeat unit polymerase
MTLVTSTYERLLIALGVGSLSTVAILAYGMTPTVMGLISLAILAVLLIVYHADYLHPTVAFVLPWLGIMGFSMIPISDSARELAPETYELVLSVIFVWTVFTVHAPTRGSKAEVTPIEINAPPELNKLGLLKLAFLFLYLLAVLNAAYSGYIPLVLLLTTGKSGYADFGIPSLYGFFFAYANALGCLSFYIYLSTARKPYLSLFLSVAAIHLAFITRQHLLTLLMEAFVIRCFLRPPPSRMRLLAIAISGLVMLNFLGDLRSGDIRDIIHISNQYNWIPGAAAWLYAYSY